MFFSGMSKSSAKFRYSIQHITLSNNPQMTSRLRKHKRVRYAATKQIYVNLFQLISGFHRAFLQSVTFISRLMHSII